MKKHRGLVTLLGLTAGAIVVREAVKAYTKARSACPPFRRRIYSNERHLIDAFTDIWQHPERLVSLRRNSTITRDFAEKLMLTVTGVNGCRYCTYLHSWYGARQGLSAREVTSLLSGDVEHARVDEAPALFFAQQYAEKAGQPDDDLVHRLVDEYGPETARDIVTLIRLMTVGNLVGNTFDALVSRGLGRPAAGSTLRSELLVLGMFCFGIAPLAPVLTLRAVLAGSAAQMA